ncbi:hypothetical protein E4T50_16150 [Aureobasidium sp. EXF-12298]|nr:hypothetical protein E4T50_16150 [Aureobasidium sp. EXF-12298]KAI4751243.1 hypothetical protein E4T51_15504 [Aureobasidium sp. EXF-12344]KAI4768638.1 hypothetical protein E4T52_16291 [Aureobasidium sp. EXF-3400]
MSTGIQPYGQLVRLRALSPAQLPAHPDLAALQAGAPALPDLETFITNVLTEASTFMTDYLPQNFAIKDRSKKSPPAKATIQLLAHEISASKLGPSAHDEAWFARTSLHENKKEPGTANWDEFEAGLLDDHSLHESQYTPDVFDAHKVLSWDSKLAEKQAKVGNWEKVGLSIFEMCHHIPPPLDNRAFPVLVVTARSAGPKDPSFLVVQIPVDITKLDNAMYSTHKNKLSGDTAEKRKPVTLGQYVSIERCTMIEDMNVKWQMATASDAKGNLPMWAQKMGIPSAVIKDVGLFIDWNGKRRK